MSSFTYCEERQDDVTGEGSLQGAIPGSKKFLEYFGRYEGSWVNNLFLGAVRDGVMIPDAVVARVADICEEYLSTAARSVNTEWCRKHRLLQEQLDTYPHDALMLAEHALWWESLSKEQKEQIKTARGIVYRDAYMAAQPPTERQLKVLRENGYTAPVTSRLEASRIIAEPICKSEERRK
jgi:hypothetical protein